MFLSRSVQIIVCIALILSADTVLCQEMQGMKMPSDSSKIGMGHDMKGHSKQMAPKDSLVAWGKYNCCLKKACNECYRDGENCNCYTTVKKSGVVCRECYQGWQKGEGRVRGIKRKQVTAED